MIHVKQRSLRALKEDALSGRYRSVYFKRRVSQVRRHEFAPPCGKLVKFVEIKLRRSVYFFKDLIFFLHVSAELFFKNFRRHEVFSPDAYAAVFVNVAWADPPASRSDRSRAAGASRVFRERVELLVVWHDDVG